MPATEEMSRVAGLQTGAYDYAEVVPITSVDSLKHDPAIKVMVVKPKCGVVLELNPAEGIMSSLPFRRALVAALNMGQVMQATSFGNRRTISVCSPPSSSPNRPTGTRPREARYTTTRISTR